MERLLKHFALFSVPFCIYATFIVVTDPFNFLFNHSLIAESTKQKTAGLINPPLWKMSQFDRTPRPNILVGDSRMGHVPIRAIREITGQQYFNFWYGGATLREMIDTFWFAAKRTRLQNVVIGINFNVYNDRSFVSRTDTYAEVRANPFMYFVDHGVARSAVLGAYTDWFHGHANLSIPSMSRRQFWHYQIETAIAKYADYERPKRYRADLEKVTAYCRQNGINCTFIIFPTHVDLQKVVKKMQLTEEFEEFKRDLASMAVTYDYDYVNPLTMDASNFADPFHFTDSVGGELVREIWEHHLRYGRKLSPDNVGLTQAGGL
jgi:hypothetical protein